VGIVFNLQPDGSDADGRLALRISLPYAKFLPQLAAITAALRTLFAQPGLAVAVVSHDAMSPEQCVPGGRRGAFGLV
jgi:hypothetical protein